MRNVSESAEPTLWWTAADFPQPLPTDERSHYTLQLLSAQDKVEHVLDDVLTHFQ